MCNEKIFLMFVFERHLNQSWGLSHDITIITLNQDLVIIDTELWVFKFKFVNESCRNICI